jgi:hypothetical protein
MSQEDEYYVAQYAVGMYAVMTKGSLRPVKMFKTQGEAEQRVQEMTLDSAASLPQEDQR